MTALEEKWSVIRKINNFSLLRMISKGLDWHLRHCLKFLNENEQKEFDEIAGRYLEDELHRKEHSLDDCLNSFAKLFLLPKGAKLMDLHIRAQRFLRDADHRDHVNHMLGVFLLTAYLIQVDLDTLTLTRNIEYFKKRVQAKKIPERPTLPGKKWYPPEDTMDYYPKGEIFAKAFDPLNKIRGKFFYADTFYFLFLFHDIGYLYELKEKLEKTLSDEVERTILKDFHLSDYIKHPNLLEERLKKILSFPFAKRSPSRLSKLEPLVGIASKEFKKNKNHGVASSLVLYSNFESHLMNKATMREDLLIQESENKEKQEEYKKAFIFDCLGAICLHDLKFTQRIGIQDSFHYFLLKLSDTICDWSRHYKGRRTFYCVQLIDEILVGFRPEKKNGKECVRLNVIFDFSNLEALVSSDVAEHGFEIKEFKAKAKELNQLDYKIQKNDGSLSGQWLFFEMILIDRNGERHKISNERNQAKYTKIECPLFF